MLVEEIESVHSDAVEVYSDLIIVVIHHDVDAVVLTEYVMDADQIAEIIDALIHAANYFEIKEPSPVSRLGWKMYESVQVSLFDQFFRIYRLILDSRYIWCLLLHVSYQLSSIHFV